MTMTNNDIKNFEAKFLDMTTYKSPNYSTYKARKIVAIIDHITAGSFPGCATWLCNPAAGASAHYLVTRSGNIFQLVYDKYVAWHAGIVEHPTAKLYTQMGNINPNKYTIGIEHENLGGGELTEIQYQSTLKLHDYLCSLYDIPRDRDHITGHFEWAAISRANDPGPKFPWERLMNDLTSNNYTSMYETINITVVGSSTVYKGILKDGVTFFDEDDIQSIFGPYGLRSSDVNIKDFNIVTGNKIYLPLRDFITKYDYKINCDISLIWNSKKRSVEINPRKRITTIFNNNTPIKGLETPDGNIYVDEQAFANIDIDENIDFIRNTYGSKYINLKELASMKHFIVYNDHYTMIHSPQTYSEQTYDNLYIYDIFGEEGNLYIYDIFGVKYVKLRDAVEKLDLFVEYDEVTHDTYVTTMETIDDVNIKNECKNNVGSKLVFFKTDGKIYCAKPLIIDNYSYIPLDLFTYTLSK